MRKKQLVLTIFFIFVTSCNSVPSSLTHTETATVSSASFDTITPIPTSTNTQISTHTPTSTPLPIAADEIIPTQTPKPIIPVEKYPPILAWDFYPNGLTREALLVQLPEAVQKSGHIGGDETWTGVIHITGDVQIDSGVTLTIEPNTLVLIAARSDDQHDGHHSPIDQFNPKDPPFEGDQRVEFWVEGNLIVRGTADEPVIFTSDAANPRNDDWGKLLIFPGSSVEITRAIVEFFFSIGIESSTVEIRQSIIRNTMTSLTIGHIGPDTKPQNALDLKPIITQNYVYNTGRHAITIRSGSPTISHNVIIARLDLDTTGWEQAAIGTDFPTCPIIHHNFLDGGLPSLYQGEIFGEYHEFTQAYGAGLRSMCLTFDYNTITGSPLAIEGLPGSWPLEHNNILPQATTGLPTEFHYWPNITNETSCLVVSGFVPEPSDTWQFEFIEHTGGLPIEEKFSVANNFWGTTDPQKIEKCLWWDPNMTHVEYKPFELQFIEEALPDWHEFEW